MTNKQITTNKDIANGKPIIKGTRIKVSQILELLANGLTPKEITNEYPQLKPENIKEALLYASQIIDK